PSACATPCRWRTSSSSSRSTTAWREGKPDISPTETASDTPRHSIDASSAQAVDLSASQNLGPTGNSSYAGRLILPNDQSRFCPHSARGGLCFFSHEKRRGIIRHYGDVRHGHRCLDGFSY